MAPDGGDSLELQCLTVQEDCAEGYASFSLGYVPCYCGLASNSLSFIGSIAMMTIYIAWKDLRQKGAQSIVTFIAIADFFTAAAYFVGSINIISYSDTSVSRCRVFFTICEIESYVATCATMSSYLWTLILAFHLYLVVVKSNLANRLMPVYHVIGWGLPVAVTFPLLCVGKLAYAPFVAAVWCYLESAKKYDLPSAHQLPLAIAIKLPEILGYVLIIIFYLATRVRVYTQARRAHKEQTSQVYNILSIIPALFILFQVWGTVQFFYYIHLARDQTEDGCIENGQKRTYLALAVLQAIGAGGQGWANAIVYIFLAPTIRQRLFGHLHCNWCQRFSRKHADMEHVQLNPSSSSSSSKSYHSADSTRCVRSTLASGNTGNTDYHTAIGTTDIQAIPSCAQQQTPAALPESPPTAHLPQRSCKLL